MKNFSGLLIVLKYAGYTQKNIKTLKNNIFQMKLGRAIRFIEHVIIKFFFIHLNIVPPLSPQMFNVSFQNSIFWNMELQ